MLLVALVQAALPAHHTGPQVWEGLHVVLPLRLRWRVAPVLHCRVWRACLGLAQWSNLAAAWQHSRVTWSIFQVSKASSNSHVLLLVHHGRVAAGYAHFLGLRTSLLFGELVEGALRSEWAVLLLGRARFVTTTSYKMIELVWTSLTGLAALRLEVMATDALHDVVLWNWERVGCVWRTKSVGWIGILFKATEEATMRVCLCTRAVRSLRSSARPSRLRAWGLETWLSLGFVRSATGIIRAEFKLTCSMISVRRYQMQVDYLDRYLFLHYRLKIQMLSPDRFWRIGSSVSGNFAVVEDMSWHREVHERHHLVQIPWLSSSTFWLQYRLCFLMKSGWVRNCTKALQETSSLTAYISSLLSNLWL